jgi:hypothetical protein
MEVHEDEASPRKESEARKEPGNGVVTGEEKDEKKTVGKEHDREEGTKRRKTQASTDGTLATPAMSTGGAGGSIMNLHDTVRHLI